MNSRIISPQSVGDNRANAYYETRLADIRFLRLKMPLFAQIELTDACNQHCAFCYNVWRGHSEFHTSGDIMPLSEDAHNTVIDILARNELFSVTFSGGEPLLVKWLDRLISKVTDKGMDSALITNGVLLSYRTVQRLKESGLCSIQISLHHHTAEKHNAIVGSDAFDRAIIGLRNALDVFGDDCVNVNMVALPETFGDVYEMARAMQKLGVKYFSVGTPSVTGLLADNKQYVINKKAFQRIFSLTKATIQ